MLEAKGLDAKASQQGPGVVDSDEITRLLRSWSGGNSIALERLIPIVYQRLHRLASGFLMRERSNHTLQATALVHEAYLRLAQLNEYSWNDRAHFFALSARMMRRVLVDHGRKVRTEKRGGDAVVVNIEVAEGIALNRPDELLALDQALRDLAVQDLELAQIVELRYFGGLSREEIAVVLQIGSATVTRRWRLARAWLFQHLSVESVNPRTAPR